MAQSPPNSVTSDLEMSNIEAMQQLLRERADTAQKLTAAQRALAVFGGQADDRQQSYAEVLRRLYAAIGTELSRVTSTAPV